MARRRLNKSAVLILCVPLLWLISCAPAQKKDESRTAAETIAEVKKEKESRESAETTSEPRPGRDWKQHVKDDWGNLGANLKADVEGLWARQDIAHNVIVLGGAGG